MKKAAVFVLAAVTSTAGLRAAQDQSAVLAELRRLNDAVSEMQVTKDVATADRLLADEYVFLQADGEVADKARTLAVLKSPDFQCQVMTTEDVMVRVYGESAVITGIAHFKATFGDQIANGDFRYTDVWVRRNGRWQTVSSHASSLPKRLQPPDFSAQLIGTWKLMSWEERGPNGQINWPLGTNAIGMLTYDPYGHMSLQMMEARGDGLLSYFGTYNVAETTGTIAHHIDGSSVRNMVGTDMDRRFTLRGDSLTLSYDVPRTAGNPGGNGVLRWERVAP